MDAFEQVAVTVEEGAVDPGAASDVGDAEFRAVCDGVVERGKDTLAASGGVGSTSNSEPSRPNRTCRKNASASATTARSSPSTVQYRTPDGNLTRNARTPISSRNRQHYHYQPRAPHPGRSVAEPARVAGLRNVTQQSSQPQKTVTVVVLVFEVADDHPGLEQTVPVVAVEALPPAPVVERFDVSVVPRLSGGM